MRVIRCLEQRILRVYAIRNNVTVGKRFHVGPGSVLSAPRKLEIDDDVYVGKGCTIQIDGRIGWGVSIANRVGVVGRRDHDMRALGSLIRYAPWVGNEPRLSSPVDIGDDVMVGYGAVVLGPVRIGRGAIIGAGAVVSDDVEPYAIVVGSPARVIGHRFSESEREEHERRLEARRHLRTR